MLGKTTLPQFHPDLLSGKEIMEIEYRTRKTDRNAETCSSRSTNDGRNLQKKKKKQNNGYEKRKKMKDQETLHHPFYNIWNMLYRWSGEKG